MAYLGNPSARLDVDVGKVRTTSHCVTSISRQSARGPSAVHAVRRLWGEQELEIPTKTRNNTQSRRRGSSCRLLLKKTCIGSLSWKLTREAIVAATERG